MRFQSVVILLVGLAASTYALDLSHANLDQAEIDPRIFSFINDFYAQVVYPPLNHIVTNVALLGAQILAGISQTGIPTPGGGRNLHPTEAELRGFFDELWNNALRPPIENALSGVALMAAQLLAGIGVNGVSLGKRDLTEAELRGFFDELWNNALRPPIENALSGVALMAAQLLAGIGVNGVSLGKRDLTEAELRGFFDELWNNALRPPIENALSGVALMAAQLLAGVGVNGVSLGKRDLTEAELRGFFDELWNNALRPPIENALSGVALMAAQLLAGVGVNGVSLGKRDLTRGPIIDDLVGHATGLYVNQVKPILENALNNAALHLAGVLANFSQNGFGRR